MGSLVEINVLSIGVYCGCNMLSVSATMYVKLSATFLSALLHWLFIVLTVLCICEAIAWYKFFAWKTLNISEINGSIGKIYNKHIDRDQAGHFPVDLVLIARNCGRRSPSKHRQNNNNKLDFRIKSSCFALLRNPTN